MPVSVGSVQVIPAANGATYRLYIITQEGGIIVPGSVSPPQKLSVPDSAHVLAGLNGPVRQGAIQVTNLGSGSLTWTAQAGGSLANRIHIDVPSGQVATSGTIPFSVDMTGLAVGMYHGSIVVDAGSAGSSTVAVTVQVVRTLRLLYLPLAKRG
jgi:hypothetical protein